MVIHFIFFLDKGLLNLSFHINNDYNFCYFSDKDFSKAIEMYTKAIELKPTNAIYYANRSLAHLRQESFGFALQDGIAAVKADPTYLKGYYRRAAAHMSLGKFKQALSDYEYVSSIIMMM